MKGRAGQPAETKAESF
ncbi:hypothetical protein CL3_31250 [butyrate-producing bacterium SM4/1]|nr:hypothetical protein CL3_31250 [butyrate-producing bacterium SM4/1]